jgi:hypothetical protein
MMHIDENIAVKIYDALVSIGGAPKSEKDAFIQHFQGIDIPFANMEWRFGGKLGFGGKFRVNGGRVYVDYYTEDETKDRKEDTQRINESIARILFPKYYIISLKHTHKRDKYLTFWGEHNCGYEFNLHKAGKYSSQDIEKHPTYYNDTRDTLAVDINIIQVLLEAVEYEGKTIAVVINNKQNLQKLGLVRSMFIQAHKSCMPHIGGSK